MRMTLVSIGLGAILGLTAEPAARGDHCGHLTMTHQSQITSCAADYEDSAVDDIHNGGSGPALICILVESSFNVVDFNYAPNQCQSHAADESLDYSVLADREVDCSDDTTFATDSFLGDDCTDPGSHHSHSFTEECDCP